MKKSVILMALICGISLFGGNLSAQTSVNKTCNTNCINGKCVTTCCKNGKCTTTTKTADDSRGYKNYPGNKQVPYNTEKKETRQIQSGKKIGGAGLKRVNITDPKSSLITVIIDKNSKEAVAAFGTKDGRGRPTSFTDVVAVSPKHKKTQFIKPPRLIKDIKNNRPDLNVDELVNSLRKVSVESIRDMFGVACTFSPGVLSPWLCDSRIANENPFSEIDNLSDLNTVRELLQCMTLSQWKKNPEKCAEAFSDEFSKHVQEAGVKSEQIISPSEKTESLCKYTGNPNLGNLMTETCYWEKNHRTLKSIQKYNSSTGLIRSGTLFDRNGHRIFSATWEKNGSPDYAFAYFDNRKSEYWNWTKGIMENYSDYKTKHEISCKKGRLYWDCINKYDSKKKKCVEFPNIKASSSRTIDFCAGKIYGYTCPPCPIEPPKQLNQFKKTADKSQWKNWK